MGYFQISQHYQHCHHHGHRAFMCQQTQESIGLKFAKPHQRYRVCQIMGGEHFKARLAALGIFPGAVLEVLRIHKHCGVIVAVHGSRFALGHGSASKILVTPV